jgi:hypothetical protein
MRMILTLFELKLLIRILIFLHVILLLPLDLAYGEIIIFFRNDDISAKSDPQLEHQVLEIFRKCNIEPLYAVIPNLGGENLKSEMPIAKALRQWHDNGWIEIGLHGFDHEFNFATLPFEEQSYRISTGKEMLSNALDMDINWFCPPWNGANKATFRALRENSIQYFSGYLGAPPHADLTYLHCNSNLFHGPLGDLKSNIILNEETDRDVLLVALYHTSYDFDHPDSLNDLDFLLQFLHNQENVVMPSIPDYLANNSNLEFLKLVNNAGYRLKFLEFNKYLRKIFMRIPLLSHFLQIQIERARDYYYTGRYHEVISIHKGVVFYMGSAVVVVMITVSSVLFLTVFGILKKRGK